MQPSRKTNQRQSTASFEGNCAKLNKNMRRLQEQKTHGPYCLYMAFRAICLKTVKQRQVL